MRVTALIFLWVIGTVGLVLWGLAYGGVSPKDLDMLDFFNLGLVVMPSIITLVMAIEGPQQQQSKTHGVSSHPQSVTLHYTPPGGSNKKKGKAH